MNEIIREGENQRMRQWENQRMGEWERKKTEKRRPMSAERELEQW